MDVKQNLAQGEQVVAEAQQTIKGVFKIFPRLMILGSIFSIGWGLFYSYKFGQWKYIIDYILISFAWFALLVVCCSILLIFINKALKSNQLILTNTRLLGKVGVFSKKYIDAPLEKVDTVDVSIGFFGNLTGFGKVKVLTGSSKYQLSAVKNPLQFKNQIMEQIELNKTR